MRLKEKYTSFGIFLWAFIVILTVFGLTICVVAAIKAKQEGNDFAFLGFLSASLWCFNFLSDKISDL